MIRLKYLLGYIIVSGVIKFWFDLFLIFVVDLLVDVKFFVDLLIVKVIGIVMENDGIVLKFVI